MNNLSPQKELSELHKLILNYINEKNFDWAYLSDMLDIADYEILCKIILDLYAYGFVTVYNQREVGFESKLMAAQITQSGMAYVRNEFSKEPLKVEITLNNEQLEEIFVRLVEKHAKSSDASLVKSFFKQAGNASINALTSELVKHMLAYLTKLPTSTM